MKSWIGEYGRVVVAAIVVCALLLFLGSSSRQGVLGMLAAAAPGSSLGEMDSYDMLKGLSKRADPSLSVTVKKLECGKEYDLLGEKEFYVKSENADGESLPVSITKLTAPDGNNLEHSVDPHRFCPKQRGVYQITYQTKENYQGSYTREVTKQYRFVVD